MMGRNASFIALIAAAFLLVSCTAHAGEPEFAGTAHPQVRPTPESAPRAFSERVPLDSCGEFTLGVGEHLPGAATECLENAVGTTGAELVHAAPTDEGDAVVTWIRALPTGGIEIWTDFSKDRFAGKGSWQHDLCPDAHSWPVLSGECANESFD